MGKSPSGPRLFAQEAAEFSNRLKIPELIDGTPAGNARQFQLTLQQGASTFLPDTVTPTLGINGDFLGPTLHFRQGEEVAMSVQNLIGEASSLHWHGLRVPAIHDGGPFQQIENGAPFELFLSANEDYVVRLAHAGWTRGVPVNYAHGVLALFSRPGLFEVSDDPLAELNHALNAGKVKRFVIANPEHAPYGSAARAALRHAGLWVKIKPLLLVGANAGQAVQYSIQAGVDAALVPLSLARAAALAQLGDLQLLPAASHPDMPLHQVMVMLQNSDVATQRFFEYLQSTDAQAAFIHHGLKLPTLALE